MKRPFLVAGGLALLALMAFPVWSTVDLLSLSEPSTQEPLEALIEGTVPVRVAPVSEWVLEPLMSLPEPFTTPLVEILPATRIVIKYKKKDDLKKEAVAAVLLKGPLLVPLYKSSPMRRRFRKQRIEAKAETRRVRKTRYDLEQIRRRLERGR